MLEDLGSEEIVGGDPPAPIEERYAAAVDVLVDLHGRLLPEMFEISPDVEYHIPRYDMDALLIEAELLLDWYLPHMSVSISDDDARRLSSRSGARRWSRPWRWTRPWCCATFIRRTCCGCRSASGIERIGLLDFQDALIGPAGL